MQVNSTPSDHPPIIFPFQARTALYPSPPPLNPNPNLS
jgi:hypothetical protein